MIATKDNKVYTITEAEKKFYVDRGFDIYDDDGNVVEYGKGKTVPYGDYMALKAELDRLKEGAQSPEETQSPEGPEKPGRRKKDGE